ncbi:MAG: NOB1 family endonuclease, partial [Nitrososphaerales archaeon]
FLGSGKYYTTSRVFDEIKHIKRSFSVLEALIDAGNLEIRNPEARCMEAAKKIARRSGDLARMSEADLSIIALAFEFKDCSPLIVTDDYAVANVAELLSIKVSYVMSKGIKKVGMWLWYCSACGKLYRENEKQCTVCGNRLASKLKSSQKH